MAKKKPKIDLEGLGFGQFEQPKPIKPIRRKPKKRRKGGRRTPQARRNERKIKREVARHPRARVVKVGIQVGAESQIISVPISARGAFAEKTEIGVASEIIHFIQYEIETQRLLVQLTAEGKWKFYTYLNVTQKQFEAFRDSQSKGRHFNSDIKKHPFLPGNQL